MPRSAFLEGNFAPVLDELDRTGLAVEGTLPASLEGTLYRNGSNPRLPPVEPYHWFTGDGMVHAITFQNGTAAYRNAWVRTTRFRAEEAAGRPLFQGFGQPLVPEAATIDTGVANTSVIAHAGRILALEEAHLPVRLDPADLSTVGVEDFGGALSGRFTAHPKHDPATGQLVFFSYSATGPLSPGMSWGTIEPDGRVSRHQTFDAPYCSMVHDFAVSATRIVFPVLPLTGDLERARRGGPPYAWDAGRGAFLGLMSRSEGAASLRWVPVETIFAFHVMNAFDAEDGSFVMDVLEYDRAPLFPDAAGAPPPPEARRSRLARWTVAAEGGMRRTVLDDLPSEYPRLDERRAGLPYRYGYRVGGGGDGAFDTVVRDDLEGGPRVDHEFGPGRTVSEAVFIPDGADAPEGAGHLLTIVHGPEADHSVLVVLDARALDRDPVASVTLPRRVPFGFHGNWVSAAPPPSRG